VSRAQWVARITDRSFVDELLPVRPRDSHKGDYGKVLLLCGSRGLTGAAVMAAKAALRTGSGLVYLGVPEAVYPIVAARAMSEIVFPLPCDRRGMLSSDAWPQIEKMLPDMDAVLFGPGLGRSEAILPLAERLLCTCGAPVVLDADGINAFEGHTDRLRGSSCPIVLTPHDGEFRRLGGNPDDPDRICAAGDLAIRTGCTVLLKGYRTVVTDGSGVFLNTTGNPGMATGGSGDVLSGILVSLLGQQIPPLEAAAAAAWIHGAAGDLAAERLGEYGLTPEDMLKEIPRLLK